MSRPVIKVAKRGEDARTAQKKDFSFNTEQSMLKVGKVLRATSDSTVAHGLDYSPSVFFMREVTPGKIGHYSWLYSFPPRARSSINDTNIVFRKGFESPDSGQTIIDDYAVIGVVMADPLKGEGTFNKKQNPIIKVGTQLSGAMKDLYSPLDTFKIHHSGTLQLVAPSWTGTIAGQTNIQTVKYQHNLGYIPFFSPFVPYQTELEQYYGWLIQWHNRREWSVGVEYLVNDILKAGGTYYQCIKMHISSATDQPSVGANWQVYWTIIDDPWFSLVPNNIKVNDLEDVKIVYGGIGGMTKSHIRVYATATELTLEFVRYAIEDFEGEFSTYPQCTITMDYTIFENDVGNEFDLLTN